jgi:uncharacterized membrane protein (UPF0127 family)
VAIKKYSIATVVVVGVLVTGVYISHKPLPMAESTKIIHIGSALVRVDVADTPFLRERGLSGRASLAEGSGMLFIFDTDDQWGIWMKEMRFAIDIVWIDAAGMVVTVAHNISPNTFPKSFRPIAPARYVLELPAGYATHRGIVEGVKIVL